MNGQEGRGEVVEGRIGEWAQAAAMLILNNRDSLERGE